MKRIKSLELFEYEIYIPHGEVSMEWLKKEFPQRLTQYTISKMKSGDKLTITRKAQEEKSPHGFGVPVGGPRKNQNAILRFEDGKYYLTWVS